jgi:hypothetical protein
MISNGLEEDKTTLIEYFFKEKQEKGIRQQFKRSADRRRKKTGKPACVV